MKIEVYIWQNASGYSVQKWRKFSKERIEEDINSTDQIIINHYLKEYRKDFECTASTLKSIIDASKSMKPGINYMVIA